MPDFGELLSYIQEAGIAILTIILIGWIIYHAAKREIGRVIGGVVVLALLIVVVGDPTKTIIKLAEEVVKKILPEA